MPRSPSSSPIRKRARLSSPTYDDQVGELTQEDLEAFDAIDAKLSQNIIPCASTPFQRPTVPENDGWNSSQPQEGPQAHASFAFVKASGIEDDPDNPFSDGFTSGAKLLGFKSAAFTTAGFASASKLSLAEDHERSPSPEAPPEEPDYDSWFKPAPVENTPVFQVPTFSTGFALAGFTKASNKGVIKPSAKALALAKAKEDAWNREEEERLRTESENMIAFEPPESVKLPAPSTTTGFQLASHSLLAESPRNALGSASRMLNSPSTPSPASFSRPTLAGPANSQSSPANSIYRPKQFKPPLLRQPNPPITSTGSPLNPHSRAYTTLGFASASSQNAHPLAAPPITNPPARFNVPLSSSAFITPLRPRIPSGMNTTMNRRTTPAPFKTPFKPGMGPSEPGRLTLSQSANVASAPIRPMSITPAKPTTNIFDTGKKTLSLQKRRCFFNITGDAPRQTMAKSGLLPQQYEPYELEDLGVNVEMLSQITPETAMYYSFHTSPATTPTASSSIPSVAHTSTTLGPDEALKELLERGCSLATKPWVDNHWALVLWKLAAMVALEAGSEASAASPSACRWSWNEVMRQLLYRYERELNAGARPPFRKIVNQDTPAACPLVVCVTNIFWSPPGVTDDGLPIEPHPELEVTDGWYRLRARVDLPMARAVRRGIIRVGRKLGVAGARLETERKDAMEILEAYDSNKLSLSGNSSHLMPWHAKLGWLQGPCISTLHSLSSDGGLVTAMDLVISKVYPVAYLEFLEDEDGTKSRVGPRNEAEELQVHEQWKRTYEREAAKLREVHEKRIARYEGYVDRLERKAAALAPVKAKAKKRGPGEEEDEGQDEEGAEEEEGAPDYIDAFYDELEYPDTAAQRLAVISARDAAWLALHIRRESERARERVAEDVAAEMTSVCPPRTVRSFQVLIVADTHTHRRPGNRVAQLTVWDAAGLSLDEDGDGGGGGGARFAAGQRFLVTNLIPQQLSAWMDCAPGSEVYLSTRKDSRWTRIRGGV